MDALVGATLVADPEPYVGRLAAASPCADTANDAASTSGGSRGVPLFASARVPPSNDAATTIEVVEDLAVFAGGAVWCLDWAPARGGTETTRHVAVEARAKDDVAHALGAVGRARGPGLVQVMALRMPSSSAPDPGAARAAKGKRPRDPPFREKAECAAARVVLGLAHDAKHAFDLKWRPSPPTVRDGAVAADAARAPRNVIGSLAAALGNGRVEVWRVPTPEHIASEKTKTHTFNTGSNPVGDVPVVACVPAFVGVAPADAGVPLCVDWAVARPRNRVVAGTSAGAVVLWTLPSSDDDVSFQEEEEEKEKKEEERVATARPTLPVMRIASTGCPQRSVRFAPLGFSAADSTEDSTKESDSSFLVIVGGHGMHAPAVFDTRDPFSTSAGSRVSSFGGHNATTRVAIAPNGVLLSSRDDGDVDAHDFFFDARLRRPPRDNAERVARRALAHDSAFSENAIRTFADVRENDARKTSRKQKQKQKQNTASTFGNERRRAPSTFAIEPSLALDRGAAWSVDVKPAFGFDSNVATEDVGCVLVLAGFGRAGARLAFLNLGNGLRKVNASRGKDELRDAGEPVDFAFVGATATFSRKDGKDGKDRHEGGAEDFARDVCLDLAEISPAKDEKQSVQSVGVAALTRRADETARERAEAVRVGAPAHRGAGGFGFVAEDAFGAMPVDMRSLTPQYAPVRCVRWLDPETPVSASPDRAWCAWGDDAGFVRFQRLRGDAVAATARAVSAMETRN